MQALLFSLALSSALGQGQVPSVTLHWDLKDGSKASYKMEMVEHLESSDANVTSAWTETSVKKNDGWSLVVDNTDYAVEAGGMQVPAPPPGEMTFPMTTHGAVGDFISMQTSISKVLPDLFLTPLRNANLDSGPFTFSVKNDPAGKALPDLEGQATLVSIENGLAKIDLTCNETISEKEKPLRLKAKVYVRVSDSELDHMEGTFSELPPKIAGRYNVQSADFKVKRVTSD